jgi:ABC-type multidrug transport system ATPase subunit
MTPVKDLSGGQRRRLQLLLILLDEPNVLILDEPTNDLDTDMLAALEDLLDSFPGTLLVVSHDRYLLERVTDQQYAVLDHRFRHLPGGLEQYLALRKAGEGSADSRALDRGAGGTGSSTGPSKAALAGAELRVAEKERSSLERRINKLTGEIDRLHHRIAEFDQSDYVGLGALTAELQAQQAQIDTLETRWLDLSEQLD